MCLAIPGKIEKIDGDKAIVSYGAEKKEARILDRSFREGDYVVVANKIILDKIPAEEARERIELWEKAIIKGEEKEKKDKKQEENKNQENCQ